MPTRPTRRPAFTPALVQLEDRLAPTASLVSGNSAGTNAGNSRSMLYTDAVTPTRDASRTVSADGRYVLFQSYATDLIAGPVSGGGVLYVRDRVANTTKAVTVAVDGKAYGGGDSSISADGRFVVFEAPPATGSAAFVPGFVGGSGAGGQLYIRNLQAGTTALVSVRPDGKGGIGAGGGYQASVSDDGRYVAFRYTSDDLAPGDSNGTNDIFVRDTVAGTTKLVSHTAAGGVANGNSIDAVISGNGKTVVFRSLATNLTTTPDANATFDLFAYAVGDGKVSVVSTNLAGTATGDKGVGFRYRVDGTGTKVAFVSPSTDLTAVPGVVAEQVYARDLTAGTTRLLSLRPDGKPLTATATQPAISADGRFVTFVTDSSLSPVPSPNSSQAYLVEVATGRLELASRTPAGTGATGNSEAPTLSGDGRYVAFLSNAPDLVPGTPLGANGANNKQTLFVYDRLARATVAASVNAAGSQTLSVGNSGGNTRFAVSRDGSAVVFTGDQTGYGPADTNGFIDVYAFAVPKLAPLTPTAAIDQGAEQADPTATGPVEFTVTFNQPVSGFDAADIDLSGSTAPGALVAAVAGGSQAYTVTVSGMTGPGDVRIAVPAGAAVTAAGAPTPAAKAVDNLVRFTGGTANTPPQLTGPATAATTAGTAVGPLFFTLADSETPVNQLKLSVASSNPGLVPVGNVVISGTAADTKLVTITPAAGQTGTATITLTLTDGGGLTDTVALVLTVGPAAGNTPPTIAGVADQTTPAGTAVGPLAFAVGDAETPAGNLTVTALSNNTALVPTGGITVAGSGAARTVTVTPAAGRTGTATVTLTVTDAGGLTATDTFTVTVTAAPTAGGPPLVGYPQYGAGQDAGGGQVALYNPDESVRATLAPFGADFAGGVRTAAADFNRDGVADLVAGTGPGRATRVVVLDGVTQKELFAVDPFEATFTGGVYVAAGDLNGDGIADLVITPDEGGGPRCRVFTGAGFSVLADFFGIDDPDFRGGARAAVGDVDGDGAGDLIVAAGFQGGPRVAGFGGRSLGSGNPARVFPDFFAFEQTLRNGTYVAAGDVDGDGKAEVIAGGGPGGGPRVTAFSGSQLLTGAFAPVANFFGGDPDSRGGIRVAVKDLDGDARADVVVGSGAGAGSRVTGYLGADIPAAGTPAAAFDYDAFPGIADGVFVG